MSVQFKSVEPRLAPPQPRPTHRSGRPRCSPSEEQGHHSVEASVRTSGRQSCVASASKTQICRTARRPRGARAASRARCAGRASDLFFVRPNAPGDDLPSPVFSATMPRGTSHGAARLLALELDQAGERRTRHASRAHSPRAPIALALFMPPASVGVCRERRRLRWSRCASRARATRRSCSASA